VDMGNAPRIERGFEDCVYFATHNFSNKARTSEELLLVIQSLATFLGVQSDEYSNPEEGIANRSLDMELTLKEDIHATTSQALGKVHQPKSSLRQDVQLEPPGEVDLPELQKDVSFNVTRWKDVRMPFTLSIETGSQRGDVALNPSCSKILSINYEWGSLEKISLSRDPF
ncbi:hypothetical protein L7F22_041892, partial [Adiantum nelumboides]|nr:hypothetical protein [Adiantum nelumboides]